MSTSSSVHQEIATLYTDHHGWLQGWLRKKLGDVHQAADLAHDTFMRLLAREEPVQAREPRAFLTTVAQRVLAAIGHRAAHLKRRTQLAANLGALRLAEDAASEVVVQLHAAHPGWFSLRHAGNGAADRRRDAARRAARAAIHELLHKKELLTLVVLAQAALLLLNDQGYRPRRSRAVRMRVQATMKVAVRRLTLCF